MSRCSGRVSTLAQISRSIVAERAGERRPDDIVLIGADYVMHKNSGRRTPALPLPRLWSLAVRSINHSGLCISRQFTEAVIASSMWMELRGIHFAATGRAFSFVPVSIPSFAIGLASTHCAVLLRTHRRGSVTK